MNKFDRALRDCYVLYVLNLNLMFLQTTKFLPKYKESNWTPQYICKHKAYYKGLQK